jgi:hypothetical protein
MHSDVRELDRRSTSGLDVTLLWSRRSGMVFVCVDDAAADAGFHLIVDAADALDAFRHPYAYLRAQPCRRTPRDDRVDERAQRSTSDTRIPRSQM